MIKNDEYRRKFKGALTLRALSVRKPTSIHNMHKMHYFHRRSTKCEFSIVITFVLMYTIE